MISRKAIQKSVDRLVERFNPLQVVLFGSHARGQAGPDSDVDLIVVCRPGVKPSSGLYVEMRKSLNDLRTSIDLLVVTSKQWEWFKEMPGTVAFYAAAEGKVLHPTHARKKI